MREVLEETHGVMVYQEQVMRILNLLGGIDLGDAYTCIKAISKKKLPMIARFHEQFITGAQQKGLERRKAEELFGMIEKFAGYGFNKSHSTAYALIAYQTAYLKAHYPVEFMAALLSGDIPGRNFKSKDSLVEHLEDCRRMEVDVVPPDVNRSEADFAVQRAGASPPPAGLDDEPARPSPSFENGTIHFGLSAIKACGSGAADAIVAARQLGGPFASLFDFCERVDPQLCNRATIEALVKAGAFDALGARRAQLMAAIDRAMQSGAAAAADRRSGQRGLFDEAGDSSATTAAVDLPNVPEFPEKQRLAMEKEVLGFYLTSHPLAEHESVLRAYCSHTSAELAKLEHRSEVLLGGMLSAIKFSHTKNPRPGSSHTKYAMWDLEDLDGVVRCILWPEQFAECGQLVEPDAILAMRATVDRRPGAEEINLIVTELIPLAELPARFTSGIVIRVREGTHGMDTLEKLREIVRGYPGKKPLRLRLDLADGGSVTLDCATSGVAIDPELRRRVDDLLGAGNFKLLGNGGQSSPSAPTNGRRPVLARR
jgi:DNA polymerase-3 subunit alpha